MLRTITTSIRRKLLFVTLSIVLVALLLTAFAVIVYDARTYHDQWANDLITQADILGTASSAALAFNDAKAAGENLASLRLRPHVLAGAIYDEDGILFADYRGPGNAASVPPKPGTHGYAIDADRIAVFHPIQVNDQQVGTVFLSARYELLDRMRDYSLILALAIAASLAVTFGMSIWLQEAVTGPVLQVAQVAQQVMERRDYSLRVTKTTEDEVGVLVDAFNDMLAESGRRSQELEEAVTNLSREMRERHAAEDALRAADQRKDEFLATLAHELRNPLAPIRNGLQIMRLSSDPKVVADVRAMMERQLQHMVRLVDDLLEVSRITTGKLVLQKSRIKLAHALSAAIESVQPLITAKGHALSVQLTSEEIELDADSTRLSQIFANILNNAAKYTNPGGQIRVSVRRLSDAVEVSIIDNGIGIAPRELPSVFDMFAQIDSSLDRAQGGLGVGLALSRRLAEMHGGTISARSEGPGSGSEFIVRLPVALPVTHSDTRQAQSDGASISARRILLVDDNRDFVNSLSRLLQLKGHSVMTSFDGESAERIAEAFRPDIAFVDLGLPNISGHELARRLRSSTATCNTLLVAVTGWGQDRDRETSKQAGFNAHLVKPVDFEQILSAVAQADVH